MTTEKQIQAAVTKYRKLKAEFDRLYQRYNVAQAKYIEAERKRDEAVKKSQAAARKTNEFRDALKKKGILNEVVRRA